MCARMGPFHAARHLLYCTNVLRSVDDCMSCMSAITCDEFNNLLLSQTLHVHTVCPHRPLCAARDLLPCTIVLIRKISVSCIIALPNCRRFSNTLPLCSQTVSVFVWAIPCRTAFALLLDCARTGRFLRVVHDTIACAI